LSAANESEYKIEGIAFPAISCGVYGYPVADAAAVALRTCATHAGSIKTIHLVLFGDDAFEKYESCAKGLSDMLEPVPQA
jgi:O-acetyl-ADP-ribose deacetylase